MPIGARHVSQTFFALVLGLAILLTPHALQAHGGGLDSLGCHHDRTRGGFHCHRGSLADRSFGSKSEAERALSSTRSTSQRPSGPTKQPSTPPSTLLSRPGATTGLASERDLVVTAQNLLRALGYEPGVADGRLGPRTVSAIRSFQEHRHLPVDGQVSGTLLVHLSEAVMARGVL